MLLICIATLRRAHDRRRVIPSGPERAEVFDAVAPRVARSAAARIARAAAATREELARVHTPAYLDQLAATAGQRGRCSMPTRSRVPSRTRSRCWRPARRSRRRAHAREHRRAGDGAGPAAGSSRRARSRDGVLPLQQHRESPRPRCAPTAPRASPSSTSTCITATARRRRSTTIRPCSSSRAISSRTTRARARPTRPAAAAGRGFTVNVPLAAGATDADYEARVPNASCCRRSTRSRRTRSSSRPASTRTSSIRWRHADDDGRVRAARRGCSTPRRDAPAAALALVTEGGYHLDALEACLDGDDWRAH